MLTSVHRNQSRRSDSDWLRDREVIIFTARHFIIRFQFATSINRRRRRRKFESLFVRMAAVFWFWPECVFVWVFAISNWNLIQFCSILLIHYLKWNGKKKKRKNRCKRTRDSRARHTRSNRIFFFVPLHRKAKQRINRQLVFNIQNILWILLLALLLLLAATASIFISHLCL